MRFYYQFLFRTKFRQRLNNILKYLAAYTDLPVHVLVMRVTV